MPTARATTVIDAPVDVVFAYVDDWRHAPVYTQDLVKWEPAGEQTKGLGSVFHAAMKMGPITQESTLEIVRYQPDAELGWEPRAGFSQRGAYTFTAVGDGTEVSFEIQFDLPGGMAGRLLGKTIEPILKQNVSQTLKNLKRELQGSG